MFQAGSPGSSSIFEERRRSARFAPEQKPSIVVELEQDNAGTLIDLSVGGLCVRSVAKLRPDADLALNFRLPGAPQAIENVGRIAWLEPNHKLAGICFNNPSVEAEQQIADWLARQQHFARDSESATESFPESSSTRNRRPSLPTGAAAPHSGLSLMPERLSLTTGAAIAADSTSAKSSGATDSGGRLSTDIRPAEAGESAAPKSRNRRRNLAILSAACAVTILVVYLLVPNLRTSFGSGGSGGEAGGPDAVPPAEWVTRARAFFGIDAIKKIDPAKEGVPVWAVKQGGFYYCTDSPYFRKLQPGTAMTQGEALQSGYQPKLGGYCR